MPDAQVPSASRPKTAGITASNWRVRQKNTLQGFIDLTFHPSGLIIKECSLHVQGDRRWIGLPGKPQMDQNGVQLKEPNTGKVLYANILQFATRQQKDQFERIALGAIDSLISAGR